MSTFTQRMFSTCRNDLTTNPENLVNFYREFPDLRPGIVDQIFSEKDWPCHKTLISILEIDPTVFELAQLQIVVAEIEKSIKRRWSHIKATPSNL